MSAQSFLDADANPRYPSVCGSKVEVLAVQALSKGLLAWTTWTPMTCAGVWLRRSSSTCSVAEYAELTGAGCRLIRLRMSHAMVLMTLLQNDSSSSDLGITWHLGTRNTQQISEVPQLLHKITKSYVRPEIQNWSISLKKQVS